MNDFLALNFLLYCMGVSVVVVATAFSVRLARKASQPQRRADSMPVPVDEQDALATRLRTFQRTKFGAPIGRRHVDKHETED